MANSDVTMPDYIKTWRQTLRDLPQNNTTESQYDTLLERNSDGSLKNSENREIMSLTRSFSIVWSLIPTKPNCLKLSPSSFENFTLSFWLSFKDKILKGALTSSGIRCKKCKFTSK